MYRSYAQIYEAIRQGSFAEALVGHMLADLPTPPQRVLDLACGTAAAMMPLAAAGMSVVGVDRSAEMLAIAQAKVRDRQLNCQFVQADLRDLPIEPGGPLAPASFDLITCLYDSLNYLLNDNDLHTVFAAVRQLLRPGGRLVFDLNTEAEFQSWDEGGDQVVYDAHGIFVYNRLNYRPELQRAYGRIVWFVRDDTERWWRDEELHVERVWPDADVLNALADNGLRLLARRTPEWQPAEADAPRVVYVAERRAMQ
jgi:SAM-dependent methyltransferase